MVHCARCITTLTNTGRGRRRAGSESAVSSREVLVTARVTEGFPVLELGGLSVAIGSVAGAAVVNVLKVAAAACDASV